VKMSQDLKLNFLQWSKGQCRSKVIIYLERYADVEE